MPRILIQVKNVRGQAIDRLPSAFEFINDGNRQGDENIPVGFKIPTQQQF